MGERDVRKNGRPQRDQTDESLRVERDKADVVVVEKREAVELEADEVIRIARDRADQVVQLARDTDDCERPLQSHAAKATSERERTRADILLEHERSIADAAIETERAKRKRYLADFLAVEREATDTDLSGERTHADTVIEARDEFLATVSHDLRNLLGGLSLTSGLLVKHAPEGTAGDKMRSHAATIQRLVARMNRLVNDLLDISSIEAGKLAVVPKQVEIAEILRDTLDAFEPLAAAKHITIDADDAAATGVNAQLDGGRILQVLANLVSNAVKFTPAGGRVSIRIRTEGNELQFAVSDTGIGISQDALEAVFERFRQLGKERGGLGLGLHISKCIVEAHGGKMWAESKLGAGSTFHFVLPASAST